MNNWYYFVEGRIFCEDKEYIFFLPVGGVSAKIYLSRIRLFYFILFYFIHFKMTVRELQSGHFKIIFVHAANLKIWKNFTNFIILPLSKTNKNKYDISNISDVFEIFEVQYNDAHFHGV